jgi:hypothetical protein
VTKKELLRQLIAQAHGNGFDLMVWFRARISREWPGWEPAIDTLASGHRYYALLFSHDFAKHFWKQGEQIRFAVPTHSFPRLNSRGEMIVIKRKAYTRRTLRPNAWQYHLREMAALEEPLRYIQRFLAAQDHAPLQPAARKRRAASPLPPPADGAERQSA